MRQRLTRCTAFPAARLVECDIVPRRLISHARVCPILVCTATQICRPACSATQTPPARSFRGAEFRERLSRRNKIIMLILPNEWRRTPRRRAMKCFQMQAPRSSSRSGRPILRSPKRSVTPAVAHLFDCDLLELLDRGVPRVWRGRDDCEHKHPSMGTAMRVRPCGQTPHGPRQRQLLSSRRSISRRPN